MGLDMYLYRKGVREKLDALFEESPDLYFNYEGEKQVAYWRKANQIHAWFVRNVQGGEDECRPHDVNLEQLAGLVQTCRQVLEDRSLASELLPTQSGFFFGTTEYDEWYWDDIESTIEQLEPLLDPEYLKTNGIAEYEYVSSW